MGMDFQEILAPLLSPIEGPRAEGEDLSYSPFLEHIGEARRADDPSLAQGEWVTTLKVADWGKARQLCEVGLRTRGKDLQLAMWYAEAQTRLNGYAGAAVGLRLVVGLLENYWETFYPQDLDERVGKLEWLNSQLALTLRKVPLTKPEHGGYDWHHWQESRIVENLRRGGGVAFDRAIKDGKLSGDVFDKNARESGFAWYQKLLDDLAEARAAYGELARVVDERFGEEAPGFGEIRDALNACQEVARRMFEECGGNAEPDTPPDATPASNTPGEETPPSAGTRAPAPATGPISSRAHAVRQLREIARYFREHEPHSPVSLLVERAAKWGEMPLETWLRAVIKDEPTLKQLHELLDIRPNDGK